MCKVFYYKKYSFDAKTGDLSLNYQIITEQKEILEFTEHIYFPNTPLDLTPEKELVLNDIFFLTHIAFGISYYKTVCPEKIIIETGNLSKEQAAFFEKFYVNGLGEFAVKNQLNLQGKIKFPFVDKKQSVHSLNLKSRFLVPVGGGKDSCVSMELLKKINADCCAISVGIPRPIRECIEMSGLSSLTLTRKIDPYLITLNQSGTVKNGHVPITGMLAFLLWASAVIYDYRFVALSCEKSANSGNLMQGDLSINHQYSKSFEFEYDFYNLTKGVLPNFRYFSLLRPLSELSIAKLFAQNCSDYFSIFTSCNKAFKLDESKRLNRWCGCCDKCRFVFLILAPFMDKETLIQALGNNPLNDETQINGYCELLGLSGHKPFECVGEIAESQYAFQLLSEYPSWKTDYIIQTLKTDVMKNVRLDKNLFTSSTEHLIPELIQDEIIRLFNRNG